MPDSPSVPVQPGGKSGCESFKCVIDLAVSSEVFLRKGGDKALTPGGLAFRDAPKLKAPVAHQGRHKKWGICTALASSLPSKLLGC